MIKQKKAFTKIIDQINIFIFDRELSINDKKHYKRYTTWGAITGTKSYILGNIHRYTPITLYSTGPLQNIIIIFHVVLRQKRNYKHES